LLFEGVGENKEFLSVEYKSIRIQDLGPLIKALGDQIPEDVDCPFKVKTCFIAHMYNK
jgi:hypothetical protein